MSASLRETRHSTHTSPSSSLPAAETVTPNHKEDEWLMMCRCESARSVITLLQSLESITKTRKAVQPVTVFCSPSNLTFHVQGTTKQLQASIDMQSTLFSEYRVRTDQRDDETEDWQAGGEFSVNLTSVLECLQLLGVNPGIQLALSYNLTHEVLKIELLHETVLCTAAIPGMDSPTDHTNPSLVKAFSDSPVTARIIFMSNTLQHITTELQLVPGATIATVSLTEKEGWVVAVVGHLGECLVSIPAHGSHVINLEIRDQHHACYSYPLSSLLASLKGLDIAQETCITINAIGMMAIQHQILDPTVGGESPSFIDFILCSLKDDDENDDEESNRFRSLEPLSQVSTRQPSQRLPESDEDEYTERSRAVDSQSIRSNIPTSRVSARSVDCSQSTSTNDKTSPTMGHKEWWDESDDDESDDNQAKDSQKDQSCYLFGRPRQRARHLSPPSRRKKVSENQSSTLSPNLMESTTPHSLSDKDSDDEETSEMLDITAAASPQPGTRQDECSSPELLYGK